MSEQRAGAAERQVIRDRYAPAGTTAAWSHLLGGCPGADGEKVILTHNRSAPLT
jgi:hypothetical protein